MPALLLAASQSGCTREPTSVRAAILADALSDVCWLSADLGPYSQSPGKRAFLLSLAWSSRPKNVSHLKNVGNKPQSSPHDSATREPQIASQLCYSHCKNLGTVYPPDYFQTAVRLRPCSGEQSCPRPFPWSLPLFSVLIGAEPVITHLCLSKIKSSLTRLYLKCLISVNVLRAELLCVLVTAF